MATQVLEHGGHSSGCGVGCRGGGRRHPVRTAQRFAEDLLAFGTHADVVVGRDGVEADQWSQIWPAIEDFAFEVDELRVDRPRPTA